MAQKERNLEWSSSSLLPGSVRIFVHPFQYLSIAGNRSLQHKVANQVDHCHLSNFPDQTLKRWFCGHALLPKRLLINPTHASFRKASTDPLTHFNRFSLEFLVILLHNRTLFYPGRTSRNLFHSSRKNQILKNRGHFFDSNPTH